MDYLIAQIVCFVLTRLGWTVVEDTAVWRYLEHRETGQRRVMRLGPGDEPINYRWLLDGRVIYADQPWMR
jgi:hypothetical protein